MANNTTSHPSFASEFFRSPLNWLLIAIPTAACLHFTHAAPVWVFITAGIAIIPLAGLMGQATDNLSTAFGAGIGGLLNATFGNAAELIIALMILRRGPEMYPLVKASLTGSIIGNLLLVLGAAILAGGLFHRRQTFNRTAAGMEATLLALASVGLLMPTVHHYLMHGGKALDNAALQHVETLSEEIAVILAVIYVLSLVFSLGTHRDLFTGEDAEGETDPEPEWNRKTSIAILLTATAATTWMSELLAGTVEHTAAAWGMNQVFIGVVVIAVVGNAAEHSTAVMMAMRNKMDLAIRIAVGSSLQVALFVAPVLVFASLAMGNHPVLDLHFTPMEMISVIAAVGAVALVCQDGESHWMEGVMLLGVYVIIALAFYHLPAPG